MNREIRGKIFVIGDNIDTDQIIPANYLTLVPTVKEEYEKLGSYALIGLPDKYEKYIKEGKMKTEFPIILAGKNFGCGSSREHAPISLGAAGCKIVIAESFARIFFRNCIATGELYPIETEKSLVDIFHTGEEVIFNLDTNTITRLSDNVEFLMRDMGDVKNVIDNGGIFEHARKTKMI